MEANDPKFMDKIFELREAFDTCRKKKAKKASSSSRTRGQTSPSRRADRRTSHPAHQTSPPQLALLVTRGSTSFPTRDLTRFTAFPLTCQPRHSRQCSTSPHRRQTQAY